jgi:hypothetical protein
MRVLLIRQLGDLNGQPFCRSVPIAHTDMIGAG